MADYLSTLLKGGIILIFTTIKQHKMNSNWKFKALLILCSVIIAVVLFIFALSNRYQTINNGAILDNWTKEVSYNGEIVYKLGKPEDKIKPKKSRDYKITKRTLKRIHRILLADGLVRGMPIDYDSLKTSLKLPGNALLLYKTLKSNHRILYLPPTYDQFRLAVERACDTIIAVDDNAKLSIDYILEAFNAERSKKGGWLHITDVSFIFKPELPVSADPEIEDLLKYGGASDSAVVSDELPPWGHKLEDVESLITGQPTRQSATEAKTIQNDAMDNRENAAQDGM